jgi:acetyl-CoA C-acetyltransferase
MDDLTPVIIGVGEASERIDAPDYAALSPVALASQASWAALDDALSCAALAPHVDTIAAVRQFEVSIAGAVAPFGRADNVPRAVARRIGADPARAILEPVGGQGPQHLVNELCGRIAPGEIGMALICGAEAISTVRHLTARGETRDWSEEIGGELEDRGLGDPLLTADLARHGAATPISVYALFENARRARLGEDRDTYRLGMARRFAPMTKVAADNPHAMSRARFDAATLAAVTPGNRMLSEPYPLRLVARDQANQGAAVLMASVGLARKLGVPEEKFVYLHGGADARERMPMERQDLSRSPASIMAARGALAAAGVEASDVDVFDLYSCFPIAVTNILEGLGIPADDPRPFTVTGGLPYFGGAGNNYSMHAIASMVRALREHPGALGFVGANGGFLTKYSAGVYSTTPKAWTPVDNRAIQAEIEAWPAPTIAPGEGRGVVETYTINHGGEHPRGVVIGRLDDGGARFVAATSADDPSLVERMLGIDPLGATVEVALDERGRSIIQTIGTP